MWKVHFYDRVDEQILEMPAKLQARIIKLLELMEKHGAHLGPPLTKSLGDGLFEVRARAHEGIARALFCYLKGEHIIVLHVFVKKTRKTPKKELTIARTRQKEVGKI